MKPAIALMLIVVIVGIIAIVSPVSEWRNGHFDAVERARADLVSLQDRKQRIQRELDNFQHQDLSGLFWTAAQTGEATALIQSKMSGMASRQGILLRSVTPFTPRQSDIPGAFGFKLEFEAHLDQLVLFLKDLEYGQPSIVVQTALFRRLNRPGEPNEQPSLFVQMSVLAPVKLTGNEG
jgi:hypothetical protein